MGFEIDLLDFFEPPKATEKSDGVVKVEKVDGEEAPYTVPTIGTLRQTERDIEILTNLHEAFKNRINSKTDEMTNTLNSKTDEINSTITSSNEELRGEIKKKVNTTDLTFEEDGKTYLARFTIEDGQPTIIADEIIK